MNGEGRSKDSEWTPYVRTALVGAGAVAVLALLVLGVFVAWLLTKDGEPAPTPPPTAGVVTTSEVPVESTHPTTVLSPASLHRSARPPHVSPTTSTAGASQNVPAPPSPRFPTPV